MNCKFSLPFPPSANTYYRNLHGRTILSKKGRLYREEVIRQIGTSHDTLTDRLHAIVRLYPPDRRARDWDNFQKAVWDSLQHAGVYQNDRQVRRVFIDFRDYDQSEPARVDVEIGTALLPDRFS